MTNLYKILGIPATATQESIKTVYRELSRCWHPDRPGGNAARFQAIAAAYHVLSDKETRSQWDAQRAQWLTERDAVDCPRCWTPNRLRLHGIAMQCGACQAPLNNIVLTERIVISPHHLLYARTDRAEGVITATIDKAELRRLDVSGALRSWLFLLWMLT